MTAIDALRQAHQLLRKAVPQSRRKAHQTEGKLASAFRDAMHLWDQLKANGGTLADFLPGLERTLRDAWPQTREWKFLCSQCSDYGLVMAVCPGDATCGRTRPHLPHDFGTPCWCEPGKRYRVKPKPSPDDFTQAGRSKPTRVGRN
jgi:hypothetical protein